jgi:hypothetical protein
VTSKTAACPPPNAALLTKQLGGAGHMGGTRAGGTGLMKAQPMVQAGSMRLLPPQGGLLLTHTPFLRVWFVSSLANAAQCAFAYKPFQSVPSTGVTCTSTFPPPHEGGVYSSGAAGNQAGHRVLNTKASPAQGRRGCTTPCLTPTLHASRRGHATATLTSLHWTEEGLPHATTCRRTVGVTVCHFGTGGRRAARPIKAT